VDCLYLQLGRALPLLPKTLRGAGAGAGAADKAPTLSRARWAFIDTFANGGRC